MKGQALLKGSGLMHHGCVCLSLGSDAWDTASLLQVGLSRAGRGGRDSSILWLRLLPLSREVAITFLKIMGRRPLQ